MRMQADRIAMLRWPALWIGQALQSAIARLAKCGEHIFAAIVAHRAAQAEKYLLHRLPMMSDSELSHLGVRRDEIDSFVRERLRERP